MKKIMFNDEYGLTDAVLKGRKTMTRRFVGNRMTKDDIKAYLKGYTELANKAAYYKIGEVIAVAQAYKNIIGDRVFFVSSETGVSVHKTVIEREKGWNNKMFVCADLMPHQIKITDIKMERLQDISDEDCLCEGIEYDREVGFENGCYYFNDYEGFRTPRNAFATIINRINGKSTWEINPWVFVYEFELIEKEEI